MESTTLPGSSKRAKAPGSIAQVAHCLVDGCNADLSQCREYHRRHKVCESHSKTPKVTIGGREQRFCQQCSRFHSLIEFDEGKRSCRKRLDGHNRRRRKPQPESLSRNPGLIFPNEPGARLLSFGNPEPFSSSIASTGWAGVINTGKDTLTYSNQTDLNYLVRQNSLNEASAHDVKGINQFQFLQSTECSLPEVSIRQPHFGLNSASASSSQKIFADGSSHQVVDSDRALSLLSSGPSISREIGLSHHMVQPDDSMHHSQPLSHHSLQQFTRAGQYPFPQDIESKPVVSVADSQISNHSNLHFQEMFQNGPDGSSTSGSQQTLTFMWE
ncbi:hypothetical protein LIER_34843 [Lithospermum erythrorhizon]|uniref:SBP-type domain-containing protein n=1 Tax=Lithospermum erythrorhizon TaxID=34254 RepID=A0AAV3S2Y7_LITER